MFYLCSENKGTDQLCGNSCVPVTAQLICVFVLVYAKSRFSHDASHITRDLLMAFGLFGIIVKEIKHYIIHVSQSMLCEVIITDFDNGIHIPLTVSQKIFFPSSWII